MRRSLPCSLQRAGGGVDRISPVELVAELKRCGIQKDLQLGKLLHSKAVETGLHENIYVSNTLISMYSRCGDLSNARAVFDRMVKRSVVSWNVLLLGYVENGESLLALDMFDKMTHAPDPFTFAAVIKACVELASGHASDKQRCLKTGKRVHKQARELGFDKDLVVASSLVDMYSKAGDMEQARSVFNSMTKRNVVTWTTLIAGYVENGHSSEALVMYNSMDCEPNSFTFAAAIRACGSLGALRAGQRIHDNVCKYGCEQDEMVATCLVDLYGKCGVMAAAEAVFNRMHRLDIVSWTSLIGGYSLLGDTSRVFCLVRRMQDSGLQVDSVTMLLVLKACSHAGMVEEGQKYFQAMVRCGLSPAVEHYGCMVDMLGRANKLDEALNLVREMPCRADGVIWTGLLLACRKWSNMEVGRAAFQALVALNEDKGSVAAAYVLMRSIYESLGLELELESEQLEAERKLFGTYTSKKKRSGRAYWCNNEGLMYTCGEDAEIELKVKERLKAIRSL